MLNPAPAPTPVVPTPAEAVAQCPHVVPMPHARFLATLVRSRCATSAVLWSMAWLIFCSHAQETYNHINIHYSSGYTGTYVVSVQRQFLLTIRL